MKIGIAVGCLILGGLIIGGAFLIWKWKRNRARSETLEMTDLVETSL